MRRKSMDTLVKAGSTRATPHSVIDLQDIQKSKDQKPNTLNEILHQTPNSGSNPATQKRQFQPQGFTASTTRESGNFTAYARNAEALKQKLPSLADDSAKTKSARSRNNGSQLDQSATEPPQAVQQKSLFSLALDFFMGGSSAANVQSNYRTHEPGSRPSRASKRNKQSPSSPSSFKRVKSHNDVNNEALCAEGAADMNDPSAAPTVPNKCRSANANKNSSSGRSQNDTDEH